MVRREKRDLDKETYRHRETRLRRRYRLMKQMRREKRDIVKEADRHRETKMREINEWNM